MNRKEFIQKTCKLGIGCGLGLNLLTSCSSSNYFTKTIIKERQLQIPLSEFNITKDGKISQRKFVLARIDNWRFPICIYRINENTFSALSMECSHRSCELNPHGQFLICPCHGSEFDQHGKVQNPPAEENLKTFITKIDQDNLYVQLY